MIIHLHLFLSSISVSLSTELWLSIRGWEVLRSLFAHRTERRKNNSQISRFTTRWRLWRPGQCWWWKRRPRMPPATSRWLGRRHSPWPSSGCQATAAVLTASRRTRSGEGGWQDYIRTYYHKYSFDRREIFQIKIKKNLLAKFSVCHHIDRFNC